ncbi:MAG: hydrogenase assembly chaperone HypC/HupF [Burkholderiaceae bacterium]|nr:hydrogenase assembly chaperone HypC/HupF [Burkholderiaceae bacterium]
MCLAIPAKVVEICGEDQARIDIVGVQKEISTALIDNVAVGDYLIVHVGHAIGRLDPAEAEKTLAYLAEMSEEDARALAAASM